MSYSTLWRGLSGAISATARRAYPASAVTPHLTPVSVPAFSLFQPSWFGSILGLRTFGFKTNRSAYKRFRVRGNGSLKRLVFLRLLKGYSTAMEEMECSTFLCHVSSSILLDRSLIRKIYSFEFLTSISILPFFETKPPTETKQGKF